jgi:hypothetical protein
MKAKRIQGAIAGIVLAGSLIALSAHGAFAHGSQTLKAKIPFAFYAGGKLMPAGEYRVKSLMEDIVLLTRTDSSANVLFFVVGAGKETKNVSPRIIFHAYGDEKYLSELWWGQEGSIEPPSAKERELSIAHSQIGVSLSALGR